MPRLPMDEQRYPVDNITQHTSCELHRPFDNITIKVYIYIIYAIFSNNSRLGSSITSLFVLYVQAAYESALPILPGQTSHGMEIPLGYARVDLEQIVDSQYEGLELDLPGGDGERTLGDALHGIIIWCKCYIIIPGMEASLLPVDPSQ